MLLYKLKEMECNLQAANEEPKLKTIKYIKSLLLQINHSAELIPEYSINKVIKLIKSLKGSELTKREINLIQELNTY